MLESGDYGSIADLARAEKIGHAYVSAMLRLTLLAPDIVEAILEGRQGEHVTLEAAMAGAPVVWREQQSTLQALPAQPYVPSPTRTMPEAHLDSRRPWKTCNLSV